MAGIAGKAGNLNGKQIAGGNVFEGPRTPSIPVRPQPDSHAGSLLRKAATELGYHPFPAPSANLPRDLQEPGRRPRGPCTYCGFCERFGCEVGAKADPTVTVIPLALKTGKFELRMRRERVPDQERRQDRAERPLLRRASGASRSSRPTSSSSRRTSSTTRDCC